MTNVIIYINNLSRIEFKYDFLRIYSLNIHFMYKNSRQRIHFQIPLVNAATNFKTHPEN